MNRRNRLRNWKSNQFDWDFVLSQAGEASEIYCLKPHHVAIMLAIVESIGWKTRWYSYSDSEIVQDTIDAWQAEIELALMSPCDCVGDSDDLTRFDEDGDFQTSSDGGATWTDAPEQDPRNSGTAIPPLGGSGGATRCASADNIRDLFESYRDELIDLLTAGTTFTAIIAAILAFIGTILGVSGVAIGISVLLIGLAAALISLTPESVADQIDSAALETFKCILYCHMQDNGQFTYQNWKDVLAEIAAQFDGFPETFFYSTVNSMGYIGLSNAGTLGVSTADDCGGCDCSDEWCYIHDFTVNDGGWVFEPLNTVDYGIYNSGIGWSYTDATNVQSGTTTGNRMLQLKRTIPATNVTEIEVVFDYTGGTYDNTAVNAFVLSTNGINRIAITRAALTNGTHIETWSLPAGISTTNAIIFLRSSRDITSPYAYSGSLLLKQVAWRGTGVNPFGEDNCL